MGKRFVEVKDFEPGEKILWDSLKSLFGVDDESPDTVWHGLPTCGKLGKEDMEPDVAILDRKIGLLIIEVKDATIEQIECIDGGAWYMSDSWYSTGVKGRAEKETPIFQARKQMFSCQDEIKEYGMGELINDQGNCIVVGNRLVCLPFVSEKEFEQKFGPKYLPDILFKETLKNLDLDRIFSRLKFVQKSISEEDFLKARCAVSGAPFIAKPTSRPPKNSDGKWAKLRECRKALIPNLSWQQEVAGNSIPDGPQKIRGLAGTGKTIVMAMKFAHAHSLHPDWKILVTYGTKTLRQILYSSIKECITAQVVDPGFLDGSDFPENLEITHAHSVIYAMCTHLGVPSVQASGFRQFLMINSVNLISKIEELRSSNSFESPYDFVLVDESQDLPDEFLRLCLCLAKQDRFVWGIDEMQQLDAIEVRSPADIFGVDLNGQPRVSLSGLYPGDVPKDLMLNTVYRTPRPVLVASHIYGLGLLRKRGCVQFLTTVSQWNDIGYEVEGAGSDDLTIGDYVSVSRSIDRSPNKLEMMAGYENILETKSFKTQEEEFDWIAQSIKYNIEEEGFPPEEILVIHLLNSKVADFFIAPMKKRLDPFTFLLNPQHEE